MFKEKVGSGPQEVDVLEWLSRLAIEAIAQAGLGHTFRAMEDDDYTGYVRALKDFMHVSSHTCSLAGITDASL